jgi:two-component system NarL family sensor kinase
MTLHDLIEAMRKLSLAVRSSDAGMGAGAITNVHGAALAILGADGRFRSANDSCAALFGYPAAELAGKRLDELAPDAVRAALLEQLSTGPAPEFRSLAALLHGRSGQPVRLLLHQQAIAPERGWNRSAAWLTLFAEPLPQEPAVYAPLDERQRHSYLTQGQEKERQRLSAELHDGLGQALTLIKLMVEDAQIQLRQGQLDAAAARLDDAVLRIRESIGEVRQICADLCPLKLDRQGLPLALDDLCRRVGLGMAGLQVVFDCDVDDGEVPDHLKADMYRVAQEALNNSLKHAAAGEIRLSLRWVASRLLLAIRDNGVGCPSEPSPTPGTDTSGLGLLGMQYRVEASGGVFAIQSSPDGGTLVSASWAVQP